jgi:hypothetical protein
MTGAVTVTVHRERSSYHLPAIDLGFQAGTVEHYRILEGDPTVTSVDISSSWQLSRGGWSTRTHLQTTVTCSADAFKVAASLTALEGEKEVAVRRWERAIPRQLV